jgi:transcriptional regulator with XRE-family HTH domain
VGDVAVEVVAADSEELGRLVRPDREGHENYPFTVSVIALPISVHSSTVHTVYDMVRSFTKNENEGRRMKEEAKTAGEVFAARVREIRGKRGWKQEDLASEILKMKDEPTQNNGVDNVNRHRVLVARTETGERRASIDDLFLFAAALGVSPLALLVDDDDETQAAIGPALVLPAPLIGSWFVGQLPLRAADVDIYSQERPMRDIGDFLDGLIEDVETTGVPPENHVVGAALWAHVQMRRDALAQVLEHGRTGTPEYESWIREELAALTNLQRVLWADKKEEE